MTLGEMLKSFRLYAVCSACDRMVQLDVASLAALVGRDVTVQEVRRRVRCKQCGRRTRDIRIVFDSRFRQRAESK